MNQQVDLRVAVGSHNPAKIEAARAAFRQLHLPVLVTGHDAPSGVSSQPFSDEETLSGALNRAKKVLTLTACDFGIGLEGGVIETAHGMLLCNYAVIATRDGNIGIGGGVRVALPNKVAEQVRGGSELGDVIDAWHGGKDIRRGDGTIGILTRGQITRSQMFRDAILCALAPFLDHLMTAEVLE